MKIFSFLFLLIVFPTQIYAQVTQEWVVSYNDGPGPIKAAKIEVDNFGNVFVTGRSQLFQDVRLHTIKYNSLGQVIWAKQYSKQDAFPFVYDMKIDLAGNIYVMVKHDAVTIFNSGVLLIKYNANGDTVWTRLLKSSSPNQISITPVEMEIDSNGNVFLLCSDFGEIGGVTTSRDYVVFKFNENGEILKTRFIDNDFRDDHPRAMSLDNSGHILITGYSFDENSNVDAFTVKLNNTGDLLWSKVRSNSEGYAVGSDKNGNLIVAGFAGPSGAGDILVLKYNIDGNIVWERTFNGTGNNTDYAQYLDIDNLGNIYILGLTFMTNLQGDLITIKYNGSGVQQWVKTYGGSRNFTDFPVGIRVDQAGNSYIAGITYENGTDGDYLTIAYNTNGDSLWTNYYDGSQESDEITDIKIDQARNVYVTGTSSSNIGQTQIITTIKFSQTPLPEILKPNPYAKFIAGEKDSITWIDPGWLAVNIICKTNVGTPSESEVVITQGMPNVNSKFLWSIPDTLLSYRSKIIVENANNTTEKIESDIFRIKPYVLTRLNSDSTYYEYKKNRDQWGFSNIFADVWPFSWWQQFNYQGIDTFTNSIYSQWQADSSFSYSQSSDHMDWVSWVNTFSVDACYYSTLLGIYRSSAVLKWESKRGNWNGSCFGIAVANALSFSYKEQFQNKYQNFPTFVNPITVVSDNGVKDVVNQLYTHQFGNPHLEIRKLIGLNKTPNQTLNDLKEMLAQDNSEIRTLSFLNNGPGGGGHAVLAYGLTKDPVIDGLYYVQIYDNSNPTSNNHIQINSLAGNGFWAAPDWAGWGGNKWFYLRNPSEQYLVNPTLAKGVAPQSPFNLGEDILEINNKTSASIQIKDNSGNQTGFINNLIKSDIPGSVPNVIDNGSETPPYGYSLPIDNYSVVLNQFEEDIVSTFFFTGNKSFVYKRSGVTPTQTDRLFFDGGVSAANPDAQTKIIKLLNLINETTQEKLAVIRSIELAQNDSVKIENPDSNKVKLISFGTTKNYNIELNYLTENGLGRFVNSDVSLEANTSHTFVPVWLDLTNTELQVLVDNGNDGTIDDTLSLVNQVTGIIDDQGSLLTPNSFNLAQNYPNPFNPSTKISWQSPVGSHQTLKVYDVLGNEVATIVDEFREAGRYEITFDASNLSSGIYFYRLQAGSFVETKKMIFLK
ncbi:T9SS type A sorting domain-containing protein [Ignavibacterium sp.]|jgi:hypothetical protein|uniref:T9SS type A sorting domain-containing protein n=1 Tax=Ignavibacterium sp. TaxID=2651167 RepID=UPI00329A365F